MIDCDVCARDQPDAEQPVKKPLPPGDNALDREMRTYLLLVDGIARLTKLLGNIGHVPRLNLHQPQMHGGIIGQRLSSATAT